LRRAVVSLHKRLERLEDSLGQQGAYEPPLYLTLFMKEMENIEREGRGEEPIPLTPEEHQLKREQDRWFLEEYLPKVREGEVRPEILSTIDQLEEHAMTTGRRLENEE
jgi:hypothetical protein